MVESDTPKTDAEIIDKYLIRDEIVVRADFARQLERELHLKDQKIAELERKLKAIGEIDIYFMSSNIPDKEIYAVNPRQYAAETRAKSLQAKVAELVLDLEHAGKVKDNYAEESKRLFARAESLQSQLAAAQEALLKWNYTSQPEPDKDCRKLVTLQEDGMTWIGIRAWNHQGKFWQNGNEPERARVHAWMDLPHIARNFWDRGIMIDMDSNYAKAALDAAQGDPS